MNMAAKKQQTKQTNKTKQNKTKQKQLIIIKYNAVGILTNTVNLAYNVPVWTSVFCPLYTKSVLRVYRTLSVIRIYRTLSVIDINRTLSGICIPYTVRYTRKCDAVICTTACLHYVPSWLLCILHCDCFKSSINTNKVVIECFYSNMLKLQCLSTWILVSCESQAQIFKSRFQIPHVQLEMKS